MGVTKSYYAKHNLWCKIGAGRVAKLHITKAASTGPTAYAS